MALPEHALHAATQRRVDRQQDQFDAVARPVGNDGFAIDDFERLAPLSGVKAYPVRVKCATLPWRAFEAALKSGAIGATVKTE